MTDAEAVPVCASCKKEQSVVTLRHRNFCRSCATRFILQKFIRQMGSLTTFFRDLKRKGKGKLERILVVVDAGSKGAAEALVGMLAVYYVEAREGNAEKALPFVNILDTSSREEGSKINERKTARMEYTRFEVQNTIAQARVGLTFSRGRILKTPIVEKEAQPWDRLLGSFPSDSRGEARSILLNKMVTIYAKDNNYDLILSCDTATKIASKVLALTSQGRGFSLPWECGSLLKRNDIYVARPLKDLSDTEITSYLNIRNSSPLLTTNAPSIQTTTTESTPARTIDEMMSQYVSGLETSFPSIVATTGHTAEKLDFPDETGGSCLVCGLPKQGNNVKKWLDDITVTQAAPQEGDEAIEEGGSEGEGERRTDVTGEVCYGCYTLFRGSRGVVEWPI